VSAITASSWRSDLGLLGWQIRDEQRASWRGRGRGIFTFVFPADVSCDLREPQQGHAHQHAWGIPYDDFFVPGILGYGVIGTTYVNMAIGTAILRDGGVLKRMQGMAPLQ
jgi:ABC-2 type transport system permease protein